MIYKGVYHLFYQFNPYGAVWRNISWAHSISYDLVDWVHLEPAINPSQPFDINGCWSGSTTFLPGEKPAILYTGEDLKNHQVLNLAMPKNVSDPLLRE
jgi:beta-fructofuranosidase